MRYTFYLALMIAIVAMACSKDSKHKIQTGISWQLVATYNDPGNGSATWQAYNVPYLFLRLNSDSSMQADNGILPSYFDRYNMADDSTIYFINSSTGGNSKFTYSLNADELILWGPCREPCGKKFSRVYAID